MCWETVSISTTSSSQIVEYLSSKQRTRSKLKSGGKVTFDGDQLLIAGHKPDRDPVQQVRAELRWLGDLLARLTRKGFEIRGVVLFPAWWVDAAPENVI
jgi:hypothetical protein